MKGQKITRFYVFYTRGQQFPAAVSVAQQVRHFHRLSDQAYDFHSVHVYFHEYNRKEQFPGNLRRSPIGNLR